VDFVIRMAGGQATYASTPYWAYLQHAGDAMWWFTMCQLYALMGAANIQYSVVWQIVIICATRLWLAQARIWLCSELSKAWV
jgi:hypothetical protein